MGDIEDYREMFFNRFGYYPPMIDNRDFELLKEQ